MLERLLLQASILGTIALIVGCTNSGLTFATTPAVGPHPAGWRYSHGDTVEHAGGYTSAKLASGATCASCHTGEKAADGSIPQSPGATSTCFTCHDGPQGD